MRGYEAARTHCLTRGVDAARREGPNVDGAGAGAGASTAYEAGFDWGLWDYEDANGLPHSRRQGA